MKPAPNDDVTQPLLAWRQGDEEALEKLIPLVYQELKRLAHRYMRGQPQDHTLQTTALWSTLPAPAAPRNVEDPFSR